MLLVRALTGHPRTFFFIKSDLVKTFPCTQDWDLIHLQYKEGDFNPVCRNKFHWMALDKKKDLMMAC